MTERINEEDLPREAERFRYRVVIERGTRSNSRKRVNETSSVMEHKRRRQDFIKLSSDADEPGSSGRMIFPASAESSSADGTSNVTDTDEDLENTFEEGDIKDKSGDTSPQNLPGISTGKGKRKKMFVESFLALQEDLECSICCTRPSQLIA